jgi:carbonic anhydrase
MRTLLWLCLGSVLCAPALQPRAAQKTERALDPLERLALGNQRYQSGKSEHFNQDRDRRQDLAREQHPFVLVVGCSDSCVPPELVFDQGLGDLFVVRCAGEVLDDLSLASIEYAVGHLDVRTIVVLGHERCGAVQATLEGGELPGHLKYLARAIAPHVEQARSRIPAGSSVIPPEVLEQAVVQNVRGVVAELENCDPILSALRDAGELRVVGARYDLDSGAVEWLGAQAAAPARKQHGSAGR